MTTIVTRTGKGSPLTHVEVDTNFTNLNTAKLEAGAIALGSAGTPSISFTGDTNTGIYSPGADTLAFTEGGVEAMRIDSSGRLLVGTATANASGAKLQTSDGLTFPATAVASADANTLDDYEEGTWTPTLAGGTTTTYLYQNGYYVRIGRLVHVTARFAITSIGDGSDRFITGLPFSIGSPSSGSWAVDYWDSINSSVYSIAIVVAGSGSIITIVGQTAAASTYGNISIFKNGARVDFGGTYQVY